MREGVKRLCQLLKKHRPSTPEKVRALGYSLYYLGEGAFRTGYAVRGLGVVIKFPHHGTVGEKEHARYEARSISRINKLKRFKPLRRYMPVMYYFDSSTGVTVIEKYRSGRWTTSVRRFSEFAEGLVNDLFPKLPYELDFGHDNIGQSSEGNFVLLDLGLIEER